MRDLTEAPRPGAAPALVRGERLWSAAQAESAIGSLSRAIAGLVGPEADADPLRHPIAHACGLVPAAAVAIHAIARLGRPVALAHAGWRPGERARFLETARPALVVTDPAAEAPGPGWRPVAVAADDLGDLALWRPPAVPRPIDPPPGTGVLLWTSGSEGRPRVVCHGWDTLLAGAVAANERLAFGTGDTWLATLGWAHVGGLAALVRAGAAAGRLAFGPERFEPAAVAAALRATEASHVSLVPVMLRALLDLDAAPPRSLRVALLGGAATPPHLVARARAAGWPVALTYGLTEAGSQVFTAPPGEVARDPGSVGRPLRGVEARAGAGDEIELRGPMIARGALGEPAWRPDAWLRTGDLGRADADGRWTITGRIAARVVTGGANVDPGEVERVLSAHPEVRDTCVLGVPDEDWGEIVAAVVQPEPGAPPGLETRLDAWVRERLTGPRIPRRWLVVDAMPRTATGKPDRPTLLERLTARSGTSRTSESD